LSWLRVMSQLKQHIADFFNNWIDSHFRIVTTMPNDSCHFRKSTNFSQDSKSVSWRIEMLLTLSCEPDLFSLVFYLRFAAVTRMEKNSRASKGYISAASGRCLETNMLRADLKIFQKINTLRSFQHKIAFLLTSSRTSIPTFRHISTFLTSSDSQYRWSRSGVSKLLFESHISFYTTIPGPDILCNVIVSRYVTFCKINTLS